MYFGRNLYPVSTLSTWAIYTKIKSNNNKHISINTNNRCQKYTAINSHLYYWHWTTGLQSISWYTPAKAKILLIAPKHRRWCFYSCLLQNSVKLNHLFWNTHIGSLISLFGSVFLLRLKTETNWLNFGLRPVLSLTNHRSHHRWRHRQLIADFAVFLCLFLN